MFALKGQDQRTSSNDSANPGEIELFTGGSQRGFHETLRLGARLGDNRQRLGWKPGMIERVKALLRPCDVLEHANGKSSFIDTDHAV